MFYCRMLAFEGNKRKGRKGRSLSFWPFHTSCGKLNIDFFMHCHGIVAATTQLGEGDSSPSDDSKS
jgi:hypothetical protein